MIGSCFRMEEPFGPGRDALVRFAGDAAFGRSARSGRRRDLPDPRGVGEEQCNDRVHRIGQTNPVTVLCVPKTLSELMT
jgi:hypothetical protein